MNIHSRAFVLFVKLTELTPATPADVCVACFDFLDATIKPFLKESGWALPSPYGAVAVVRTVDEALRLARHMVQHTSRVALPIAIGMDWGRLDRVYGLKTWNAAASSINIAARMASVPALRGRVAVSRTAKENACAASTPLGQLFGAEQTGVVKTTTFQYHSVKAADYRQSLRRRKCTLRLPVAVDSSAADVLVYDVQGYSRLSQVRQAQVVGDLTACVERALESVGPSLAGDGHSGDGGYLVFARSYENSGAVAWQAAIELRRQTRQVGLPVRIGLAHGPVVKRRNGSFVGGTMLLADHLSALPDLDQICVSLQFWNGLHPSYKNGWTGRRAPVPDASAVLVQEKGGATVSDSISRVVRYTAQGNYRRLMALRELSSRRPDDAQLSALLRRQAEAWIRECSQLERILAGTLDPSIVREVRRWNRDISQHLR